MVKTCPDPEHGRVVIGELSFIEQVGFLGSLAAKVKRRLIEAGYTSLPAGEKDRKVMRIRVCNEHREVTRRDYIDLPINWVRTDEKDGASYPRFHVILKSGSYCCPLTEAQSTRYKARINFLIHIDVDKHVSTQTRPARKPGREVT